MSASDPVIDLGALRRLDAETVDAVVTEYAPRLNAFLRRLGASASIAEELVQETLVRLVQHAPRLRDDTRVGAWVFTVARNLWRSHRRWAWLDGTRLLELASGPRPLTPTPADNLDVARAQKRLTAAVSALPEPQREVFLLVVGEGLDPIDVAAILGLSPDATRQRLARARRTLEEALA